MSMNPQVTVRNRLPEQHTEPDDALVRHLSGFVPLSADERAYVARLMANSRTVAARTELVGEAEVMDAALVVLDGFACRYKVRWEGRRQILAYLLPGDLSDLDFALLGPSDHAVSTLSTCRVASVPRWALHDLVRYHPNIVKGLRLAKLAQEARSRDWLMMLSCGSAMERVAHLFCEVLDRLQAVGLATADSCTLPITQGELGETAGLSNVHVNRTVQELRGRGLIRLTGKNLHVLDVPRLHALAAYRSQVPQPAADDSRPALEDRKPVMIETSRPQLDGQDLAG